jgi:hypothetical protein
MAAKGKPKPMVLPQRAAAGTGKLMDNQDTVRKGDSGASPIKRRRITFDTTEENARKLKALAAGNGITVRTLMEETLSTLYVLAEKHRDTPIQEVIRSVRRI